MKSEGAQDLRRKSRLNKTKRWNLKNAKKKIAMEKMNQERKRKGLATLEHLQDL